TLQAFGFGGFLDSDKGAFWGVGGGGGYFLADNFSINLEASGLRIDSVIDDDGVGAALDAFFRLHFLQWDGGTLFIDGGAGTKMVRMEDGQVPRSVAETLLFQYLGGLPLLTVNREDRGTAVVIGSGGGIDAVTLLVAGYREIDAVEINPDFIEVVREQAAYTGGIYNDHERISVHETEGRSFLRTTNRQYDLVLMGLPIIKSARNFGNHALTENYLFTHNAFTEYRNAMSPDGMMIVIAHYRNELLRLVSNALKSFQTDGLSLQEAAQRIVAIGDAQNPTLVLRNRPFTAEEREGFKTILQAIPTRPDLNYVPGLTREETQTYRINRGLAAVAAGGATLADFAAGADENISWIGDDSPFFYQLSPSLPGEMATVGSAVLVIIAAFAALFALYLRRRRDHRESDPEDEYLNRGATARFVAFGLIGIGYITVEIAILQKFIVFWQHQTPALAVVLSVILVSSGLGSLISTRLRRAATLAGMIAGVLALLVLALVFLSPALLSLEDASVAVKVLVTMAFLAPVFVPLGMPFPTLLRSSAPSRYPWMIGFNSVTTLAGGALAMIVALQFGYTFVMLSGMLAYALLIGIIFGVPRVLPDDAAGVVSAVPERGVS
ncbi:MAG: spermidine synthase, partial [Spirochaetaceae bacterium]